MAYAQHRRLFPSTDLATSNPKRLLGLLHLRHVHWWRTRGDPPSMAINGTPVPRGESAPSQLTKAIVDTGPPVRFEPRKSPRRLRLRVLSGAPVSSPRLLSQSESSLHQVGTQTNHQPTSIILSHYRPLWTSINLHWPFVWINSSLHNYEPTFNNIKQILIINIMDDQHWHY